MQISMLALLGSRTGEARASVGTAPSNRHIAVLVRMPKRAVRQSECGSGCCNVIPAAGYGSFAVAAKPAGNILTIRMMYASLGIVSPDQGHLQRLIGQLGRRLFHA